MGKTFKYVSDFEFPSDCGFTGSSGKTIVKGYARGGSVKPTYAKGGQTRTRGGKSAVAATAAIPTPIAAIFPACAT